VMEGVGARLSVVEVWGRNPLRVAVGSFSGGPALFEEGANPQQPQQIPTPHDTRKPLRRIKSRARPKPYRPKTPHPTNQERVSVDRG
jgi:hypothetical protein